VVPWVVVVRAGLGLPPPRSVAALQRWLSRVDSKRALRSISSCTLKEYTFPLLQVLPFPAAIPCNVCPEHWQQLPVGPSCWLVDHLLHRIARDCARDCARGGHFVHRGPHPPLSSLPSMTRERCILACAGPDARPVRQHDQQALHLHDQGRPAVAGGAEQRQGARVCGYVCVCVCVCVRACMYGWWVVKCCVYVRVRVYMCECGCVWVSICMALLSLLGRALLLTAQQLNSPTAQSWVLSSSGLSASTLSALHTPTFVRAGVLRKCGRGGCPAQEESASCA